MLLQNPFSKLNKCLKELNLSARNNLPNYGHPFTIEDMK